MNSLQALKSEGRRYHRIDFPAGLYTHVTLSVEHFTKARLVMAQQSDKDRCRIEVVK